MNRKNFLFAVGSTGLALTGTQRLFAQHEHHTMSGNTLADSGSHCVQVGTQCLSHCLDQLAAGDKSMLACARSVRDLVSACRTLADLASAGSPHLKRYTAFCAEVCKACRDECKKHAAKHAICKTCADSCDACLLEMKKVA